MCCGRNRTQMKAPTSPQSRQAATVPIQKLPLSVPFIYVGNTAMTVKGPISGFEYRFAHPGARVEVDWRDRILLASIRQLRQIK